MATLFEAWLDGPDEAHLEAVGAELMEEVARIDRLLSRHDPAAEIARVNREAVGRAVRINPELLAVLVDCLAWHDQTGRAFNPISGPGAFGQVVRFDPGEEAVSLSAQIDLGGYGKGYAVEAVARLALRHGVGSALVHGGTSSIRAVGPDRRWPVALADPFGPTGGPIDRFSLVGEGLSTSSSVGLESSDLIDPATSEPIREAASCTVVAPTATAAEALSTALLVMGKTEAKAFLESWAGDPLRVAWIDRDDAGQSRLEWWAGGTA
jgi:thiamine biosynthesis lipoprotein